MTERPAVLLLSDQCDLGLRVLAETHPGLPVQGCDSYEGMAEAIAMHRPEVIYAVRFRGGPDFPRAAMMDCPTLRWIAVGGSGTDHLRPWDPARLTVTNAAGVAAEMMAEYALASMMWFAQGRPAYQAAQAAGRWQPGNMARIGGKTVLVVGLGKTGQAVARLAGAMGMTVLGIRARPRPMPGVEVHGDDALHALLARADYIVVCVPLTDATRGRLGAGALAAVKPGAVLVDLSRGGVVVQSALLDALDRGALAGAALDVFETEPLPLDSPLWSRADILVTPHCSSVFDGWEEASFRIFADNLGRYRRGEPLVNVVDPQRGY